MHPETEPALTRLAWPGNVRQLGKHLPLANGEMAAGQEVLIQDLPGELFESTVAESTSQMQPATVGRRFLRSGQTERCVPVIKICFPSAARAGADVTTALRHTQGINRKRRGYSAGAAHSTRKLKELGWSDSRRVRKD
ncbi:hypothetical protein ACVXHA_04900 [Escherichia coli]